jgi:hypothetical protein
MFELLAYFDEGSWLSNFCVRNIEVRFKRPSYEQES